MQERQSGAGGGRRGRIGRSAQPQERREGAEEEGEGGEEGVRLPCGLRNQERGRPPRRWLPLAQVWPEGRQEQLLPKELLPVHGGAVWGEEAGGAVAAGPLHGRHHLRGPPRPPKPRRRPPWPTDANGHRCRDCLLACRAPTSATWLFSGRCRRLRSVGGTPSVGVRWHAVPCRSSSRCHDGLPARVSLSQSL